MDKKLYEAIQKHAKSLKEKVELMEFYNNPWWHVELEMQLLSKPREYRVTQLMHS